jgi:hypothetical protein
MPCSQRPTRHQLQPNIQVLPRGEQGTRQTSHGQHTLQPSMAHTHLLKFKLVKLGKCRSASANAFAPAPPLDPRPLPPAPNVTPHTMITQAQAQAPCEVSRQEAKLGHVATDEVGCKLHISTASYMGIHLQRIMQWARAAASMSKWQASTRSSPDPPPLPRPAVWLGIRLLFLHGSSSCGWVAMHQYQGAIRPVITSPRRATRVPPLGSPSSHQCSLFEICTHTGGSRRPKRPMTTPRPAGGGIHAGHYQCMSRS